MYIQSAVNCNPVVYVAPDEIPLIFESAKKKLEYDSSRESQDQAFMRYFKKNEVTVSLPLVGTNFYHWDDDIVPEALTKLTDNLSAQDLPAAAEKIRNAKQSFLVILALKKRDISGLLQQGLSVKLSRRSLIGQYTTGRR